MQQATGKAALALIAAFTLVGTATAQGVPPGSATPSTAPAAGPPAGPAYGAPVGIDDAKRIAAAAVAEARRGSLGMVVAVVDTGGNLVYLEKMDAAQTGSVEVAIAKARSAVMFKRSTKVFQDQLAQGGMGLRFLGLPGVVPIDGGVPLLVGGRIIGAVGLSGGTSDQDGACALAGAAALK